MPEKNRLSSVNGPGPNALVRYSFISLLLFFTGGIFSKPSFADGFVFPADFPKELRQQHKTAFTKTDILDAWHASALYFLDKADFSNAIKAGKELEDYAIRFKKQKYEAGAYEVQGMAFEYLGQLAVAVNLHLKSLKIRERLGRKKPIALSLSHLGDIYWQLKSFKKAEDYYKKSLVLFSGNDEKLEAAEIEYNLGVVYREQGAIDQALNVHRNCLGTFLSLGDSVSIARALSALGTNYNKFNQLDSALFFHGKALAIRERLGLEEEISISFSDLCIVHLKRKEYDKAKTFGLAALRLNKKLNILEGLVADYGNLSEVEAAKGEFGTAFRYLKIENSIRDSLSNLNVQEEIASQGLSFEIQKRQYQDSIRKAESQRRVEMREKIEEEEKSRKARIQYLAIFIFIMALLAATFLIKRISLPVIWLEGGIFFTAILLFEFLLLVLDPWVDLISLGTPVYKFGINLTLGLLVFYAHNFLETKLKEKLLGPNQSSGNRNDSITAE